MVSSFLTHSVYCHIIAVYDGLSLVCCYIQYISCVPMSTWYFIGSPCMYVCDIYVFQ